MAEHILSKRYQNHFGLDLKSSDLIRGTEYATDMMNAQYKKTGAIENRRGYQASGESMGGFGLFTYNKIDTTTAIASPEVVSVSNKLHRLVENTLTVTYSGGDPTALISIFFDPDADEYKCQIEEGTSTVLDKSLGKGFDESSPVTIDSLRSDIDALTGFAASLTGATTTPAAFIDVVRTHSLASSSIDLKARYWVDVNSTVSTPFAGSETNKNNDDFENASAVQVSNILMITNGYDEVQKYDGQTVYRAGLPNVATLTAALVGAGSITGTNYLHRARYVQYDAAGNIVEGNLKNSTTGVQNATAQDFDVTVANIQAGSGFNTNCAIVAGAQVTVNTITVDDGAAGAHTMNSGDTAFFFDSVTGDYITRNVTTTTATTITVAGAAVTVADNAVISNNLRIEIYRNPSVATTPTAFNFVAEIPNDSFSATQVYADSTVDASLGALLVEPLTDRSAPPKGKYISAFRNQTGVAGNLEAPNTLYYSDVDGPEYFPAGTNSLNVSGKVGNKITGISPNNENFVIFQNPGIHVISGDIAENNIRVDQISTDIGCVAHSTIQEIRGELYFLARQGPRKMVGGQLPEPIGRSVGDTQVKSSRVDPLFELRVLSTDQQPQLKRAIGFNDSLEEKYWLYLPAETTTGGDKHENSNSFILAYDYSRDSWLKWNNIKMAGGITALDSELFWSERRYSVFESAVEHILYRRHVLNDPWTYQDNDEAISFEYKPQWESVAEPSVFKRFLWIRVFSNQDNPLNLQNLNVTTQANYINDVTKADFTITFGNDGYGMSGYGTAEYGDPSEEAKKYKLRGGKYKSFRPVFLHSQAQKSIAITGWELQIASPYRLGFKE